MPPLTILAAIETRDHQPSPATAGLGNSAIVLTADQEPIAILAASNQTSGEVPVTLSQTTDDSAEPSLPHVFLPILNRPEPLKRTALGRLAPRVRHEDQSLLAWLANSHEADDPNQVDFAQITPKEDRATTPPSAIDEVFSLFGA